MVKWHWAIWIPAGVLVVMQACGAPDRIWGDPPDAGTSPNDAGSTSEDSAVPPVDAAIEQVDDDGPTPNDTGSTSEDSAVPPVDAATEQVDAVAACTHDFCESFDKGTDAQASFSAAYVSGTGEMSVLILDAGAPSPPNVFRSVIKAFVDAAGVPYAVLQYRPNNPMDGGMSRMTLGFKMKVSSGAPSSDLVYIGGLWTGLESPLYIFVQRAPDAGVATYATVDLNTSAIQLETLPENEWINVEITVDPRVASSTLAKWKVKMNGAEHFGQSDAGSIRQQFEFIVGAGCGAYKGADYEVLFDDVYIDYESTNL